VTSRIRRDRCHSRAKRARPGKGERRYPGRAGITPHKSSCAQVDRLRPEVQRPVIRIDERSA
jgi:hypothetical protein